MFGVHGLHAGPFVVDSSSSGLCFLGAADLVRRGRVGQERSRTSLTIR